MVSWLSLRWFCLAFLEIHLLGYTFSNSVFSARTESNISLDKGKVTMSGPEEDLSSDAAASRLLGVCQAVTTVSAFLISIKIHIPVHLSG